MQKRDSICVRNRLFSCFVINYSHFESGFKNRRMLLDEPMTLEQIPAADLLKAFVHKLIQILFPVKYMENVKSMFGKLENEKVIHIPFLGIVCII